MTNTEFKDCRIGLGVSQACLARLMGCRQSQISALETGRGGRQPTNFHAAMCRALELIHDKGLLPELTYRGSAKKINRRLQDEKV